LVFPDYFAVNDKTAVFLPSTELDARFIASGVTLAGGATHQFAVLGHPYSPGNAVLRHILIISSLSGL
jgi:hypothetical protein